MKSSRAHLLLMASLVLSACSGGPGEGGDDGTAERSVAYAIRDEAPLGACPNGGISVDAGIDQDGNGALDAEEIASTQHVCNGVNGVNGVNGANALVAVSTEPAGVHCPSGGSKISAGLDTDGDGVLDAAEVVSSDYVCDGTPGPGVTWVELTGTAAQAASNHGYLANSASEVTVTLPASPALGDTVAVTGVGTGGWKIAQNAGQVIVTKNVSADLGATWSPSGPTAIVDQWESVASSADGTKLVVVEYGGPIHTSTDSGLTWTSRESNRNWASVASSADGTKLVAVEYGGQIHVSTDSGATWAAWESNRNWRSVASSTDGTKLVAVASGGQIYTSTNSGATWTPRESIRIWYAVASSADGTKLAAAVGGGQIYTSTDSGLTWTPRLFNGHWRSIASSADGAKLAAAGAGGQIYTSTDSGLSWTPHESSRNWISVACSADGAKLVAADNGGRLYTSIDSGLTWTPRESDRHWRSVASSADGTKLAAATNYGGVFTSALTTTRGTSGSISGGQYDSIEVQCLGNDTFTVLSHEGSLLVQ